MPSKITLEENSRITINNLEPNRYYLEDPINGIGNGIVSFSVNDTKDGIVVTELADGYFEVTLIKDDIDLLISMLNNLKEQIN